MKTRTNKCDQCPFHISQILNYKTDIYEDIKEKNRGKLHRCHKVMDLCVGFMDRAKELCEFTPEHFENENYFDTIKESV